MAALRTLPADIVLEMYDRPIAATLGKGESAPQAVERIRQRLLELKADLHTIASAPIPSSIAVARMKQQIAALADRGRPSVLNCAELGSEVEFAKTSVQHSGMPGWHETHEVLPLIAWLFQADLEQALEEEIREIADDASALDDDERLKRERAVLASILETERIEERLIEASEAEVARRADADFRAVLGLAALPAPAR